MHGNVWEWCEDRFSCSGRVQRGGSWYLNAYYCRSAYRVGRDPAWGPYDIGFRLCCSALPYRLLRSSLRSADTDRTTSRSNSASGGGRGRVDLYSLFSQSGKTE